MTHLMTAAIVISGAMMVQLRNVRGAMMMLEGRLRIKYFGFRSDSNLVIRPCCPSHPDSLLRVFTSVLISTHSLTTTRFSYFPARNSMSHIFRNARVSSTYPYQSVGPLVGNTFEFPFYQRLWSPYVKS